MVRVVVVVVVVVGGLLWGHDLKSQGQLFFGSRSTSLFFSNLFSHPKFPSGWDPGLFDRISLRGGIRRSLIIFLFWVGSIASRPNFSSGWDPGVFVKNIFSSMDPFIFLCIFLISPMRRIPLFLLDLFFLQCQRRRSLNKVCSCFLLKEGK